MMQKIHKRIERLRQVAGRCKKLFRILRITYSRWVLHRQLRDMRLLLILVHQDIWSSTVLECLFRYAEIWIVLGYRYRVRRVKEKTTDGTIGLLLLCHGGKSIHRTTIRMQQVDSGVVVFGIHSIDSEQVLLPSIWTYNNHQ